MAIYVLKHTNCTSGKPTKLRNPLLLTLDVRHVPAVALWPKEFMGRTCVPFSAMGRQRVEAIGRGRWGKWAGKVREAAMCLELG